jgi:hypothetical protein
MRIGETQSSGTKEYIRVAERFIATHDYDLAIEQLTSAQRNDPDNIYIHAIIERIHRLAAEASNGGRVLALTVGDEFESGSKTSADDKQRMEELEVRVKKLTTKASELVRRGAYETAFDSLMNAYLLDPVNPDLIESERVLLPAIELMRKRGTLKEGSQNFNSFLPTPPSGRRPEGSMLNEEELRRLEGLKRQKEEERLERERTM